MEICYHLFGCSKQIGERESYSYMLSGNDYRLHPSFQDGFHLCDGCNRKNIDEFLIKYPVFLELLVEEEDRIKIDWRRYWEDFKNIFPGIDKHEESRDKYYDFFFLLVSLGILSRKRNRVWTFTNDYYCPHDFLGPLYFLHLGDAIEYVIGKNLSDRFDHRACTDIDFISDSLLEAELNVMIDSLRQERKTTP
jgi:hypothetical protein